MNPIYSVLTFFSKEIMGRCPGITITHKKFSSTEIPYYLITLAQPCSQNITIGKNQYKITGHHLTMPKINTVSKGSK